MYTADPQLSSRLISNIATDLSSSEYDRAWKKRVELFIAISYLINGQISEFKYTIDNIKTIELIEEQDQFFTSLAFHLKKIAQEASAITDRVVEPVLNDFSLIGDSHVLINSLHWDTRKAGSLLYLPGITLRSLSCKIKTPARVALKNALLANQNRGSIIFSVGEIDQREIYPRFEKYYHRSEWQSLYSSIEEGLGYIANLRSCFQRFYIIGLPEFSERLAENYKSQNLELLEDYINRYNLKFTKTAEKLGLTSISSKNSCHSSSNRSLDGVHFPLEHYRQLFRNSFQLNS